MGCDIQDYSTKTGKLLQEYTQMRIDDYLPKTKSAIPGDESDSGLEDELESNSWEDTYKANRVSDSLD